MGNHSRIGEPSMPGHFTASRRSLRASSRSSASSPNGGHIDRAIVISADGASQNPCALLLIQLRSLSLEIRVCIRGLCCSSVFQPSYTGIPVSLFFATFPLFSCAHFFSLFPWWAYMLTDFFTPWFSALKKKNFPFIPSRIKVLHFRFRSGDVSEPIHGELLRVHEHIVYYIRRVRGGYQRGVVCSAHLESGTCVGVKIHLCRSFASILNAHV